MRFYNNTFGINILDFVNSSFNNVQIFNNWDWFHIDEWDPVDINNSVFNNIQIYNNTNTWLIISWLDNVFNNLKIYNNWSAMDIQNSSNLKYYWNLEIFGNWDDRKWIF